MSSKNNQSEVWASSPAAGSGKGVARLMGASIAGVAELSIFHPVDTVAKRLMTNQSQLAFSNLNGVVFKEAASAGFVSKVGSLFPGIGFGAAYKILQRVYKFGGQPVVRDWMTIHYGKQFDANFGAAMGPTLVAACSGSLIGIGEVVLLPLDALKIKAQTAPEQLKGRGVVDIFRLEGFKLYRGWGWTVARNAPGSFCLFGGSALAKKSMGLSPQKQATWTQDAIASCAGAVASITIAQPLDVIKTRVQNRPFHSPESGVSVVVNLMKHEGPGAFFKGLTPKLLVVGPKLVFSFTVAQHMIAYFSNKF